MRAAITQYATPIICVRDAPAISAWPLRSMGSPRTPASERLEVRAIACGAAPLRTAVSAALRSERVLKLAINLACDDGEE